MLRIAVLNRSRQNTSNIIYSLSQCNTEHRHINNITVFSSAKELYTALSELVFMSSSDKCSAEIVKLHAFDYLTYPLNYNIVSECINGYLRKTDRSFNVFRYMSNKSKKEIVVSKIIYLHGNGRKTIMHTKNGQTEFYRKLSDCAEEKCFSGFLDIHKSFLVNPVYIERVEGKYIILKGNERLPISRQKLKNIEEYFEVNNKAEKISIT